MGQWARFRQTLGKPASRTKLAFFLLLSITAVLVTILLPPDSLGREILLEFAVTFGAVGILQIVWDFLGGDPATEQINEIRDEVTSVKRSMRLLSDSVDGNIGIERIWPDRKTWQFDPTDGLPQWLARVCQANRVEIMSNTLFSFGIHRDPFREDLFENINQGVTVRILLYDPDSDVARLRAADEGGAPGEMRQEIESTLYGLAEAWDQLKPSAQRNLEICLTNRSLHFTQIIRADELMLVTFYLSGRSGSHSPTVQLRGSKSAFFEKYADQFRIMWNRGKPLKEADFDRILRIYPPRQREPEQQM